MNLWPREFLTFFTWTRPKYGSVPFSPLMELDQFCFHFLDSWTDRSIWVSNIDCIFKTILRCGQFSKQVHIYWLKKNNRYFFQGIYADIAESKFEFWSSFSPLPLEVVLSAGQKAREAKDGYSSGQISWFCTTDSMLLNNFSLSLFLFPLIYSTDKSDQEDKEVSWNASDLSGEGTIESMLLVEKGLRELTSLKVFLPTS